MTHANAPLIPTGRLRLARCIVERNWALRRAAERFGVSVTTAQRWAGRYRTHGKAGMFDRSSRPARCAHQTSRRRERRVLGLRVSRRWGPARIAYRLGMTPATVHRILTRYRCLRLRFTDPATGAPVRAGRRQVNRYEHAAPGELVHVDIKKLGRILRRWRPQGLGPPDRAEEPPGRDRILVHPQRRGRPLEAGLQ